ncbi:MAG: hypothetical protein GX442_22440 [Candidatus Riflebacteria bacterium]|nr:hypothetical protein [Candidatus Riflebacteria bacterium]
MTRHHHPARLPGLLLLASALAVLGLAGARPAPAAPPPVNFFNETGSLIDRADPLGDDKGPGFYQYPLDKRLRRGTFDLKRFSVYEEGKAVTFVIQIREYFMTEWPDTHKSEEQGFVANAFDIYLDLDGRPGSGYHDALPGRELEFADNMGWEKVVLVTPLSQFRAYDILKDKTDELSFQDRVEDIILPDYVLVQRDKLIIKISKDHIGNIGPDTGFQCLALGFSRVVSPHRLLNMDVRGFATKTDFGGGWDTYGDPPVMDLLMPDGQDQFEILRTYRSQPNREDIVRAKIPFLFPNRKNTPAIPDIPIHPLGAAPQAARPLTVPAVTPRPAPLPAPRVFPAAAPVTSARKDLRPPAPRIVSPAPEEYDDTGTGFLPLPSAPAPAPAPAPKVKAPAKPRPTATAATTTAASATGFLPLKKTTKKTTGAATTPAGFVPLKPSGENP